MVSSSGICAGDRGWRYLRPNTENSRFYSRGTDVEPGIRAARIGPPRPTPAPALAAPASAVRAAGARRWRRRQRWRRPRLPGGSSSRRRRPAAVRGGWSARCRSLRASRWCRGSGRRASRCWLTLARSKVTSSDNARLVPCTTLPSMQRRGPSGLMISPRPTAVVTRSPSAPSRIPSARAQRLRLSPRSLPVLRGGTIRWDGDRKSRPKCGRAHEPFPDRYGFDLDLVATCCATRKRVLRLPGSWRAQFARPDCALSHRSRPKYQLLTIQTPHGHDPKLPRRCARPRQRTPQGARQLSGGVPGMACSSIWYR